MRPGEALNLDPALRADDGAAVRRLGLNRDPSEMIEATDLSTNSNAIDSRGLVNIADM